MNQVRLSLFVLVGLLLGTASASPWSFTTPIKVTEATGQKLFHHLESSGRRNIAVSGEQVAVAWEDERDGVPRIYLAQKTLSAKTFDAEISVSGKGEAFEPSLVGLGNGGFAVAWEEEGRVNARVVTPEGLGPIFIVDATDAVQASLAFNGTELLLADAEREDRFARIVLHRLNITPDRELVETSQCAVDAEPPMDEQLYPALAPVGDRLVIAWEDRRPGHTIIMAAEGLADKACRFSPPQRISLRPEGMGNMPYGKGHGVSRVALHQYGESKLFAAWADKRDFREGYDIYGAEWRSNQGFGANVRVQDEFGGVARQWHASVAGDIRGALVVAWDDEREGDPNIQLSWLENGEWSEDIALPVASGPGIQAHPSITLDSEGNLHAAWVERKTVNGSTRLLYSYGSRTQE